MDDQLQRLARELRDETCPRAVLDKVAERIARDRAASGRSRYRLTRAIASLLLIGAITIWQWQARREGHLATVALAAKAEADRALVIQQIRGALVYVGQVLLEAAVHSEEIILNEAVPPLRNGFQTAKDKVTKPI
jgi:hypothetical protein